ncbi:response regulator receiver protein [Methylomonas lenta]|uniref:Response regulator receiver protein n=1 Tax=Methylomonas lenta TaxID=980561 RepID=A0A177N8G5_9GAMM|nr:response regulator [Methylomonas lenta]MDD2740318.1 response regulator [Methylomonas lenta]OAI14172.1 response regulator receiver protein [Methylomonas lenta]
MNPETAKILLVDDEANILKALARVLKHYSITTASCGPEALLLAAANEFDIVISDYKMPEMDGISFLEKFMTIQPNAIRMIVTGYADLDTAQNAINMLGVFRFINKPWNNLEILNAIEKGLELKRILQENKELADQVRQQQAQLNHQESILKALEAEEPGITKVNWAADGSIILDEAEYNDEL